MQATWISLVPPVVVLMSAFVTHRLNPSLFLGIVAAVLITSDFSPISGTQLLFKRLADQFMDYDLLYLFGFLLLIGIIITLIGKTGGTYAFARIVTRKIKTARGVETSSMLLAFFLFIDDYLSNLTVGYVMRPLSDAFRIPRVKLAFLVHTLGGPFVILAPVSSWLAMITSQLDAAGISNTVTATTKLIADPFFIYLRSLPFIFYSFLIIFSAWFIVRRGISFGPMHRQEEIARLEGNLFGGRTPLPNLKHKEMHNGTLCDLLVPLGILIGSIFIGILYTGGYHLFGGNHSFIESMRSSSSTFAVLFYAALLSFLVSVLFFVTQKKATILTIGVTISEGINLMYPATVMLLLASTLGLILRTDLLTGKYIAALLAGSIPLTLLPCAFFLVATVMATITGSSWGTMAILLPITVQILVTFLGLKTPTTPQDLAILFPVLGGIFSGSVCGDHISPISETTIMSSTSAGCYPLDHSYTQIFYALPAIASTTLAFLITGFLYPYGATVSALVSFLVAVTLCGITLSLLANNHKPNMR